MRESSAALCGSAYRSAMLRIRAAKPAALEASPAAVGKLLRLTMRRGWVDSRGRLGSADSSVERRVRRCERQACVRCEVWIASGVPLRRSVSPSLVG